MPFVDGNMPARRGHARGLRLAAALCAAVALAGCASAGATPLYSIQVDPTPTSVPKPGEAAANRFAERVAAGDLSYHATFTGAAHSAGNIIGLSGSMDVAAGDYQVTTTYDFKAERTKGTFAARYVGGVLWSRIDRAKWTKQATFRPSDTNSPFAFITGPADVTFVRTDRVDGKDFHRVSFEPSLVITPDQIPAPNLTQEKVVRSSFEVVVDDAGTPLNGEWKLEGRGRVSGQLQEIVIDANIVFSKVGSKVVIKAP